MPRLVPYEENLEEDEDDLIGETEEDEIIAGLEGQGGGELYVDRSFGANKNSLYRGGDAKGSNTNIVWLRPREYAMRPEYFCDSNGQFGCIVRGKLDDAWLLGAMAAVAAHPGGIIENLFASEPDAFAKYGVYTCRFYKNGEWQDVVVDTQMPCARMDQPNGSGTRNQPVPVYGRSLDLNEQWVQFLEKGYAKLYGSYEALNSGNVGEALVDLTGGSCETINLRDAKVVQMSQNGELWAELENFVAHDHVICAVNADPNRGPGLDNSTGLLVNHAYSVVQVTQQQGFELVRLRSPWGEGEWNGDWSAVSPLWDDYPQAYTAVSSHSTFPWRLDGQDGTFWMSLDDFVAQMTQLHVCRVFPDESFRQYCVHGEWVGKTAGGAPSTSRLRRGSASKGQRADQRKLSDSIRRGSLTSIQAEGDPSWFNNPQYRLTVDAPTRILVSLLQQDRRTTGHLKDNFQIGFEVLKRKRHGAAPRIWERNAADVVSDSKSATFASGEAEREVVRADILLEPNSVYNIVPFAQESGREGKFCLRIFSQKEVCVEPVADTHSTYLHRAWERSHHADTAGGPLQIVDENKGVKGNSKWCQNPQFWLKIPERTSYEMVDVKLVLKKDSDGGEPYWTGSSKSSTKKRRSSITHNALMGMTVSKAEPAEGLNATRWNHPGKVRTNVLGEVIPVKASSLKHPTAKQWANNTGENEEAKQPPARKTTVQEREWCQMSSFKSADGATMLLQGLRRDWMPHGLLIVPSLSEKGIKGRFVLEVHSSEALEVGELPETSAKTLADEWKELTAGGSHMHPTWSKNPAFHLRLKANGRAKVRITLSRPEKDWRGRTKKDHIGSMIGFSIVHGTIPQYQPGSIFHNGEPWDDSPHVPNNEVSTPQDFTLEVLGGKGEDDIFTIIPSTFEPGHHGPFFLSVMTDVDFSFNKARHDSGSKKHAGKGERRSHGH
ncbi:unnamed protein product [Chrysoparadoxa australica]